MAANSSTFSIEQIQKLELGILGYLHNICSKNNIEYFLAYGSLIGAIRHRGFIPWDDDIDIMMFRKDFYSFIQALKEENHPYYKLVSYETNPRFTAPLPKLIDARTELIQDYDYRERVKLGVYIDIFILDGVGNSFEEAKDNYQVATELYRKWRVSDFRIFPPNESKLFGIARWIKHIPNNIFGVSYRLNKLKQFGESRPVDKCKYVATLGSGSDEIHRNIWKKADFCPSVKIAFEDLQLNAPKNFDEILKREYGNYMELPPAEMRKTHHVYTLKWKNNFYN